MLTPLLLLAVVCPPLVSDTGATRTQENGIVVSTYGLKASLTADASVPDAGIAWLPNSRFASWESPVFDVGTTARWFRVNWTTSQPAGAPLPGDGGVETYRFDSADMTANEALYHFDEPRLAGAPGAVRDSSGHGHDGDVDGGGALTVPNGLFGRALSLDGGDCVTVPDTATLRPAGALTVSAWFYPRLLTGEPQGLVSKRVDYLAPTAYNVYLWTSDGLWVDIDSEDDRFGSATVVDPGRWHHVAVVFDGTRPAGSRTTLYLDGLADAFGAETSSSIAPYDAPLYLGCLPNPMNGILQGLDGLLDEVVLWHRALTPLEVGALFRRGNDRVLLQFRSCSDAACTSGTPWQGPTPATAFFTEPGALVTANARFVQYRAWLMNDVEVERVELFGDDPTGAGCFPDGGTDGGTDGGADAGDDAGTDAGATDAGADDGGAADAGVDGGGATRRELAVGCGCDASGGAGVLLALMVVVLGVQRRLRR